MKELGATMTSEPVTLRQMSLRSTGLARKGAGEECRESGHSPELDKPHAARCAVTHLRTTNCRQDGCASHKKSACLRQRRVGKLAPSLNRGTDCLDSEGFLPLSPICASGSWVGEPSVWAESCNALVDH